MSIVSKISSVIRVLREPDSFISSAYGKVYYPVYNKSVPFDTENIPEIYSKNGNRLKVCYLRDSNNAHSPYIKSEYLYWDRFNYGLDTHFYSHNEMLKKVGKPVYKYGMLGESESIVPDDYKIFQRNAGLNQDFDFIFTHSYDILNKIPNARYVPFCSNPWFGTVRGGGVLDPKLYEKKSKMVSILSSNLELCDMHKRRLQCAKDIKHNGLGDAFGTFEGGAPVKIADTLSEYRYSIAIENDIKPYWYTERITSCFASFTVPIYCGASRIADFFNPDGIIFITPDDCLDIKKILKQCSCKDYEARVPAMIDNYNRVQKYYSTIDYMYETYLRDIFGDGK